MSSRVHLSPRKKVICCTGSFYFQQAIRTHASAAVAGPDQNEGHVTNVGGVQTFLPVKGPGDDKLPVTLLEAEAPCPGKNGGQAGRMIKDGTAVTIPVPSTSIHTTNVKEWDRKNFIPRRQFEPPTVSFRS
jgi:hypothetical protein